jgi:hypothetical protein
MNRLLLHLKWLYFRIKNRELFVDPKLYVPFGTFYCYDENGKCPFHTYVDFLPKQENGYCYLMNKTDVELHNQGLLWDECKECGINYDVPPNMRCARFPNVEDVRKKQSGK